MIFLRTGERIEIALDTGAMIELTAAHDADGELFVEIGGGHGVELSGSEPGRYYPVPAAASSR